MAGASLDLSVPVRGTRVLGQRRLAAEVTATVSTLMPMVVRQPRLMLAHSVATRLVLPSTPRRQVHASFPESEHIGLETLRMSLLVQFVALLW